MNAKYELTAIDLKRRSYVMTIGGRTIQWTHGSYVVEGFREEPKYFSRLDKAKQYAKNN